MSDFYCDEVFSGRVQVEKVKETEGVLAFYHTRPAYEKHVAVVPKRHISSLLTLEDEDGALLLELMAVIKEVANGFVGSHGACRVITNLGDYQDSKHLHFHVAFGKRL